MKLRKLERKDAPFMLEWMHDSAVVENLQTNFAYKSIRDCEAFINVSRIDKENIHLAIADSKDEYMGTVSLKHVTDSEAEFAIAMRRSAMGKGYSKYGMKEIIRYGFCGLGLESIYWCVAPENRRAIRFYDKNGYQRTGLPEKCPKGYSPEQIGHYVWYKMERKMYKENLYS
ncbi:MAG: GNAT family N-acetyltransferase [Lachnospiraceae bacterium]|nr:GNAT family N-acetyltransferase [Lachnospiraceae bacterium]